MAEAAREVTRPELQEEYFLASQWQLMWRKLRRHRLALVGATVLALLYLVAIFAEFLRAARSLPATQRLHQRSAGVGAGARRGARAPAVRVSAGPDPQRSDPAAGVLGRHHAPAAAGPVRAGRPLQAVGDLPHGRALLRHPRRRGVPAWHRPARARHALPRDPRRPHLAVDRVAGRVHQLRPGVHPRRHLRVLRRHPRPDRAARHRVHHLDPHHSPVDGAVGGAARQLAGPARLLRHHRDPGVAGLGRPGARWCAASCWSCARRTS